MSCTAAAATRAEGRGIDEGACDRGSCVSWTERVTCECIGLRELIAGTSSDGRMLGEEDIDRGGADDASVWGSIEERPWDTSAAASRSAESNPVAMTVTLTFSPSVSSMLAPKMMFASSCACSWTRLAASWI